MAWIVSFLVGDKPHNVLSVCMGSIISAWAILLFVQQYRAISRPQSVDRTIGGSRFFAYLLSVAP